MNICDFCMKETATTRVVHPWPIIRGICHDCNHGKHYPKWPSAPKVELKETDLKYPTKGGCHV